MTPLGETLPAPFSGMQVNTTLVIVQRGVWDPIYDTLVKMYQVGATCKA